MTCAGANCNRTAKTQSQRLPDTADRTGEMPVAVKCIAAYAWQNDANGVGRKRLTLYIMLLRNICEEAQIGASVPIFCYQGRWKTQDTVPCQKRGLIFYIFHGQTPVVHDQML